MRLFWFCGAKKDQTFEESKDRKEKPRRSKKKWFGKHKAVDPVTSPAEPALVVPPVVVSPPVSPPLPAAEDEKLTEAENQQSRHAYSVALATAAAAEAAVAAAHAAVEVVRLTATSRYLGKSKEEIAAIKIQTAFRGYMARRGLRAMRGLVRLKRFMQGNSVKVQANSTLRCMQTLGRVQAEIRDRRIRMSRDNQARQRQIQLKSDRELDKMRAHIGEDWDDSSLSKEQIEARLLHRQEAATKRERAMAYAFSHQQTWRDTSTQHNFMDAKNPQWGWSWLERWMAARPWENRTATDNSTDRSSIKSSASSKAYSQSNVPSPMGRARKKTTPKGSPLSRENDSTSMFSERCHRRHSVGSPSSVRDDESFTSSPTVPGYMAPTQATKARSRLSSSSPSPLGLEKITGAQDNVSAGSAKKRLSFSGSPAPARRHSGPPKVEEKKETLDYR